MRQIINIGAVPNDGTGTPNRDAWGMVNDNFSELYGYVSIGATVTSGTPTKAELIAALGTTAANGAGWSKRISSTNAGDTYYWYVWTDGTDYFLHQATKSI